MLTRDDVMESVRTWIEAMILGTIILWMLNL